MRKTTTSISLELIVGILMMTLAAWVVFERSSYTLLALGVEELAAVLHET